jgi:hypothetical protein
LQARVLWGGTLGLTLLVIGLLAPIQPWIWMLLMILPCLIGFFSHQQYRLQRAITDVVDEVATEQGFTRSDLRKNPPKQSGRV